VNPRQFADKVGEPKGGIPRDPVVLLKLGPRPADGFLSTDIEPLRIEEGPLIVVTQQHHAAAVANEFHALAGIRPVADNIPKAIDGIDPLAVDIFKHGAECLEITVDVADDSPLHWSQTRSARPCRTIEASIDIHLRLRRVSATVKRRLRHAASTQY